ncbi:MAG: class I SAM-dependent methyltransferase [Chromatiales bacterium]|jgi:ubiquinone/menaquinone biosynthesis C-methylase UbiE
MNMKTAFKDYFSGHASDYARYRPDYPTELFGWLASQCAQHDIAWDCAAGSGQSALQLAKYFSTVIASDASLAQISSSHSDRIQPLVATAEHSALATASMDLVTVAQALHWFDLPAFVAELQRVLKPGGIVAVWSYNLLQVDSQVDEAIQSFYADTLGDYWPFERKMVENGYADVQLPFEEIAAPVFQMHKQWDLRQLIGYLSTWSAVKQFEIHQGFNPLETLYEELRILWLDESVKRVVWPLTLRAWRT